MNGKLGNKKAGNFAGKNGVMMIVSILSVILFIGTALQPILSASTVKKDPQQAAGEKEYFTCDCEKDADAGSGGSVCAVAAFNTVKYMIQYVKTTLKGKGIYFLWAADAAIVIFEGLILGIKESGFKPTIDFDKLRASINLWVSKLVGPQMFFITRFMARLGAISIGIFWYLLSICIDTSRIISP
jgi:hypothetical protein